MDVLKHTEYKDSIRAYDTPKEVRRADSIYCGQRDRCENSRCEKYHRYGLRGIKVQYNKRQFIKWYLENLPYYNGKDLPSVGRIDHDSDYNFENIKLESLSENSRERMIRNPNPCKKPIKPIRIYNNNTGEIIAIVKTTRQAALLTGASKSGVFYQVQNPKILKKRQLKFRFEYM